MSETLISFAFKVNLLVVLHYRVCFVKCDVTSKFDWSEMWTQAESSLGGKIEILCNNAGVPASVRFRDPRLGACTGTAIQSVAMFCYDCWLKF